MRTIQNICNDINIEYKEQLCFESDTCHYEGIIKNDTLLVKRKLVNNNLNEIVYRLYIVYDNLYINCLMDTEENLNLLYKYLTKNSYSKILELTNMKSIVEFHVELL